jgi:hypothetical protein
MVKTSFFHNDTAKVPLAVIGVFLLLVSVLLSINILRMDVRMATAMSKPIEPITNAQRRPVP